MLFCDNFHDPGRGWTTMNAGAGAARYVHGGLQLQGNPGYAIWEASPADAVPAAVRVTAAARMITAGAGGWGVWCRGTADGSRRYEFTITHTGTIYIKVGDQGHEQHRIDDFQADENHTVEGICRDLPDSGGVELIMKVDGGTVGHAIDNSRLILGPGRVGLHAATFGDVPTSAPAVLFRQFTVERDR